MNEPARSRVLLADDHQLVRGGLRALLERQPGLEVVGEAGDGRKAVWAARDLRPDLVVMDVEMPGLNGIEATRQIVSEVGGVRVLCLSMHGSARFVEAAFEAGASGYLLKDSATEELSLAVDTVLAGRTYVSPAIAGEALDSMLHHARWPAGTAFSRLTSREREVLQLLAEGRSTREIAGRLCLSLKTVYYHREQLMEKLDIRSVAGLTRYAIEQGLTGVELPAPAGEDL